MLKSFGFLMIVPKIQRGALILFQQLQFLPFHPLLPISFKKQLNLS